MELKTANALLGILHLDLQHLGDSVMSRHYLNGRRISTMLGIIAVAFFSAQLSLGQFSWVQDSDGAGNWDDPANWTGGPAGTFPDAAGATATFTQPVRTGTGAYTVTLPDFGGPAGTTIIGSLTIDNTGFANNANFNISPHSNGSILVFQSTTAAPATYTETAGTAANGPNRTTISSFIDVQSDLVIAANNIPGLNTGTVWTNIITGGIDRTITLEGSTANLQLNDATAHAGLDGYRGEWIINEGGLRLIGIGAINNSKGITVTEGGQLQLGQNNAVPVPNWQLASGAKIHIGGVGKSGGNSSDGALRFQLNGSVTSTLHNEVVLDEEVSRITVSPAGNTGVINNIVSGTGGLQKSGAGALTLNSFAHSYTGDTTVFAGGPLSVQTPFLFDASDVLLTTGGILDLNFSGGTVEERTDQIRTLYLDGIAVTDLGTYGAVGNTDADFQIPLITGAGLLEVTALPGLVGDYNNDGAVDAADFVLWAKDPASFGGDPDGYDAWVQHFGESGTGGGNHAPVPEPTTALSLLIAASFTAASRRRK
jgi:autotransporter-associated beta strand protein